MDDLTQTFEERVQDIEAYLDLLESLEQQVRKGVPRIGEERLVITVQQQRILYSSVYLQLYNLVESTSRRCVEAVCTTVKDSKWLPSDLSDEMRREWVRDIARTHTELNHDNRLEAALKLCDHLIQALPVSEFQVRKGVLGNWDNVAIEEVSKRLGLSVKISQQVYKDVTRPFRNGQGALVFIRALRNELAHGNQSFAECGEGTTVGELRDLANRTILYLREVVACFIRAINAYEFLLPDRRPKGLTA